MQSFVERRQLLHIQSAEIIMLIPSEETHGLFNPVVLSGRGRKGNTKSSPCSSLFHEYKEKEKVRMKSLQ